MQAAPSAEASIPAEAPGLWAIFLAFSGVAIIGFGGVLPWIRRMLVEQRRWMTADAFVEALSLAQFLPGGNVLNLAVAVGRRFQGATGAIVAVLGLLAGPFVIVLTLGAVYARYGRIGVVHDALTGVAAGAAGLILSMAFKMAMPLWRRGDAIQLAIAAVAFVGIAVAGLPLLMVLAVVAPASIAIAWRRRS